MKRSTSKRSKVYINSDKRALAALASGVSAYALEGAFDWPSSVALLSKSGKVVSVNSKMQDIDRYFEVPFLELTERISNAQLQPIELCIQPIEQIEVFAREEWIRKDWVPDDTNVGTAEFTQESGSLGSAPITATAVCITECCVLLADHMGNQICINAGVTPFSIETTTNPNEVAGLVSKLTHTRSIQVHHKSGE